MSKLHTRVAALAASLILLASAASVDGVRARAQESPKPSDEAARGLSRLQSGDVRGAVELLRERVKAKADDADAWHYLGLALMKGGDLKSAAQSFQTAVKLRPDFTAARTGLAYSLLLGNRFDEAKREAERALDVSPQNDEAHYIVAAVALRQGDYRKALEEADAALVLQPRFRAALDVKEQALFTVYMKSAYPFMEGDQETTKGALMALQAATGFCCLDMNAPNLQNGKKEQSKRLAEAAEIYEKSLRRTPDLPGAAAWRETLESLVFWREYFDPESGKARGSVLDAKSVGTNARILNRPNPRFTKEELKGFRQPKVVLGVVLTAEGEVRHVVVLRSLGYELTRRAVEAARGIRFEPAMKDGRPVSVVSTVEYDFKEMPSSAN